MTKDAAIELAEDGVRVNSVHPAYIDTQMADYGAEAQDATKEELDAMHPIGHMGEPDDVAYAVLYLASEESKFMTGAELVLDGGFTAQ
jgi:NAD(P)-dependent dehydrogenase (short-subunit alcohol dehydrogenase family)